MSDRGKSLAQDLGLRAFGMIVLMTGDGAITHLYRLMHLMQGHEATPVEFLFGAAGFMGLSAGAGLLVLGRHIFDPVCISARWVERSEPEASPTMAAAEKWQA